MRKPMAGYSCRPRGFDNILTEKRKNILERQNREIGDVAERGAEIKHGPRGGEDGPLRKMHLDARFILRHYLNS